jgi:hypothetical protein
VRIELKETDGQRKSLLCCKAYVPQVTHGDLDTGSALLGSGSQEQRQSEKVIQLLPQH